MIPADVRIKFDGLVKEATWHFHGANYNKAQSLLAEAAVLVMNERRLVALREGDAA